VLKVDRESKRIGLSLKRRQPDPWQRVSERFQPGQVVEGTLTRLAPLGAFVDLGEGVEGLLPTNQIANQPGVVEGATVRVRVLNVEPERQRIGLALQQVLSAMASDEEADSPLPPEPDEPEAGEMSGAEDAAAVSMETSPAAEAPEEEEDEA